MKWNISSNVDKCRECEQEFTAGQEFFSSITQTEQGFERRDICKNCWKDYDSRGSVFFWKSVYTPEGRKKMFVDDEVLMNIFIRLDQEDSAAKQKFRYLLALVLMRKKLIDFKDISIEGECEYLLAEDKEGNEYRILNPEMDRDALEDVKDRMLGIINDEMLEEE